MVTAIRFKGSVDGGVVTVRRLATPLIVVLMLTLGPFGQAFSPDLQMIKGLEDPNRCGIIDQWSPGPFRDRPIDVDGHFIENLGQRGSGAGSFYCEDHPLSMSFATSSVSYLLRPGTDGKAAMYRVLFHGANEVEPTGVDLSEHSTNYLLGNDPGTWVRGVRTFGGVEYRGLYDGIDLRFGQQDGRLKYEFRVLPGADPSEILMEFIGVDGMEVDRSTGSLRVETPAGGVIDGAPLCYQDKDTGREVVPCEYVLSEDHVVRFDLEGYDTRFPLVIDPEVFYATYLGGKGDDEGDSIETDAAGNVYVVSRTSSTDWPVTPGAYDGMYSDMWDIGIAKMDADGSSLEYCTYVGGSKGDDGTIGRVDQGGNVYVYGESASPDFPTTPGAYRKSGSEIVFKLGPSGDELVFSTFVDVDIISGLDVDSQGNVFLTGATSSIPVIPGCFDTTFGGLWDYYIAKIDPDGTNLVAATYVGGSGYEDGNPDIEIGPGDCPFIMARSYSADFPITANAYNSTPGSPKHFVTKMDNDLTRLEYSTFLGVTGYQLYNHFSVDPSGCVIYVGTTSDPGLPITQGAYDDKMDGPADFFAMRLNASGDRVLTSTFFGGSKESGTTWYEFGVLDFETDNAGNLYFIGFTDSTDLPLTSDAMDTTPASTFITVMNASMDRLLYSSYLDLGDVELSGLSVSYPVLVLGGTTSSSSLLTTKGSFDQTFNGGTTWFTDVYVICLALDDLNGTPPGAPDGPSARQGDRYIQVEWDPPSDNGSFNLQRYLIYRGDSETNLSTHARVARWTTTYVDHDVPNLGSRYYYAISAISFAGEGVLSEVVNATAVGTPGQPGAIIAVTEGAKVNISWTPPDDLGGLPILGYRLAKGGDITTVDDYMNLTNVTYYVDDDVQLGSLYYYRVRAFNEMGDGGNSSEALVVPKVTPSRIGTVRLIPGDGVITVDWYLPSSNGGSMLLGFNVFRGTEEDQLELLKEIGPSDSFYDDRNVTNGETYHYSVTAFNEIGAGPLSSVVNATPFGVPGAPTSFEGEEGDSKVSLRWDPPGDTGGARTQKYRLYRGSPGGDMDLLSELTETRYDDRGLINGQEYRYEVTFLNSMWEGPPSARITLVPRANATPPASVVTTDVEDGIEVAWEPPADTGGSPLLIFRLYRGEAGGEMVLIAELPPQSTRYRDVDVQDGTVYYYRVQAVTESGDGLLSDPLFAVHRGPPGKPNNLRPEPGPGYVRLSWEVPMTDGGGPITGYVLLRGTESTDLDVAIDVGLQTHYNDTDVEGDLTYYYSVLARSDYGVGPPTDPVEARPWWPPRLPGIPLSLQVTLRGTTAHLTWMPPGDDGDSPITHYVILRGTSPEDLDERERVGNLLAYDDEGLQRGKTFYYSVAAMNEVGTGQASQVVPVKVQAVVEPEPTGPLWVVLVLVGVLILGVVGILSTESGRYRWGLLLGPLTTRLKREEVLDNKTRHALLGIIIANPGIHYNAIMKEFDLKNGVAAYHLSVLEEKNYIRSARDGRLKRFYSTDVKVPSDLRLTPEGIREAITDLVVAQPGISQKEVVNELGIDDDTVGYHLRAMVESGELHSAKHGRYTVYTRDT